MTDPVLVEVMRGPLAESRHRGAVAVTDADGRSVLALGDVERAIFPRSAIKALQALPLVESGAADDLGFGDAELALAAASHAGEPPHVAAVARMLGRCGLDAGALACGAHWPLDQPSAHALIRAGQTPSALHNNCSGKHAGFLCAASAMGSDHHGYTAVSHVVQREVRAAIESLAGVSLGEEVTAIDGCSAPTWAVPLKRLATAFARYGTGHGLPPHRARAAARIRAACAAKPYYVAGSGRFVTELMARLGGRLFVKTGAEGVVCAALPEQGIGMAVKCDDGASRAAEVVIAALVVRFLPLDAADRAVLERLIWPVLRNWNGRDVGMLRPTELVAAPRSR